MRRSLLIPEIFTDVFGSPDNTELVRSFLNALVNDKERNDSDVFPGEVKVEKVRLFEDFPPEVVLLDVSGVTACGESVSVIIQTFTSCATPYDVFGLSHCARATLAEDDNKRVRIVPAAMVSVCDFSFIDMPDYHNMFLLPIQIDGMVAKGILHLIELPKWMELKREAKTEFEHWMNFLSGSSPEGVKKAIEAVDAIRKADAIARTLIR